MVAPPDDSLDDGALARRIAVDRDAPAEALLCGRLFPRIRAYGMRHLRDAAEASDLAQHVLVVTLEALRAGKVEEPERLAAFVMGVCRNTVLDWRKGDRRRQVLLERFGPSFATVVDADAGALDTDKVIDCLGRLAIRERTIVTLTFFADCDGDEIARELAMSTANVRVARHRALKQLHHCVTGGAS